ncbi:MAG: response regulator transcription factor [Oscillospiraceae bacterium]|nr:response regulator transcription factor [Oscillospiraceae bacterium]
MNPVLIVEDDEEIAMLEKDYLEMVGFPVTLCADGAAAEPLILENRWSLILLDVMLPGKSGFDLCRAVRSVITVPILMVTARGDSIDKIRGLGLGADDYIQKPFDPAELVARVKANIAQYQRLMGAQCAPVETVMIIGDLCIYPQSRRVTLRGEELKLPNREFELLQFLAAHPNVVFSKEKLFEQIWGFDYLGNSATVTVHIGRIREKIEQDPQNPKIIETVWGAGYRLTR